MLVTKDQGQTSDGYITGISMITVANGTVTTQSSTEIHYVAQAYYTAQTNAFLYQDGVNIAFAGTNPTYDTATVPLSANSVSWADYDLQTDHYVNALLFVNGSYENPLYFSEGGCDDANSDCTIGSSSGAYYIAQETIYLGSTLADQTNIPQDGSAPAFPSALYDNFLASSAPPYPTGVVFTAEVSEWARKLQALSLLISVAHSAIEAGGDINIHPIPLILELFAPPAGDRYVPDQFAIPPSGERQRTYLVRGSDGKPWADTPIVIKERFSNPVGPGVLPAANGCWYNRAPLPCKNGAPLLNNNQMTDHIALENLMNRGDIGFIQYFYAEGFILPAALANSGFTLPGVTDSGIAVPLYIKDTFNSCEAIVGNSQRLIPGQPVRLNVAYTGIDGDNGPPPATGCAPRR